jgi:hypothetical protein
VRPRQRDRSPAIPPPLTLGMAAAPTDPVEELRSRLKPQLAHDHF